MIGARMRKLTPLQEGTIRALAAQGVRPGVLASQYGVTRQTIYRTIHRRAPLAVEIVVIGGYYAQFEVLELGPIQRTEWRAVAA